MGILSFQICSYLCTNCPTRLQGFVYSENDLHTAKLADLKGNFLFTNVSLPSNSPQCIFLPVDNVTVTSHYMYVYHTSWNPDWLKSLSYCHASQESDYLFAGCLSFHFHATSFLRTIHALIPSLPAGFSWRWSYQDHHFKYLERKWIHVHISIACQCAKTFETVLVRWWTAIKKSGCLTAMIGAPPSLG